MREPNISVVALYIPSPGILHSSIKRKQHNLCSTPPLAKPMHFRPIGRISSRFFHPLFHLVVCISIWRCRNDWDCSPTKKKQPTEVLKLEQFPRTPGDPFLVGLCISMDQQSNQRQITTPAERWGRVVDHLLYRLVAGGEGRAERSD